MLYPVTLHLERKKIGYSATVAYWPFSFYCGIIWIYQYFKPAIAIHRQSVGSLKMNTTLEYSTRVVQEGDRRCKKSTLNDLAYLTSLRIPLMNPVNLYTVQCMQCKKGWGDQAGSAVFLEFVWATFQLRMRKNVNHLPFCSDLVIYFQKNDANCR